MKPIIFGIILTIFSFSFHAATLSNLSATTGNSLQYQMTVPENSSNLIISISSGTGDADLYVRAGSQATTSSYDCRPYLNGNNETCRFSSPQATTYYITITAYSSFSGVTLNANYDSASSGGSDSENPDTDTSGATWSGYSSYYADAIGKSGTSLINALNEAAALGHSRMTYTQVWDALSYTDEDSSNSNNVILFYTSRCMES